MNLTRPLMECIDLARELPPPDSRFILRNVSFQVHAGEVIGIVGPSGAGKSSLLRMLNRLDEATSGHTLLDGEDTRAMTPRELRRRVGMVMQRAYLFPGTVRQNIAFGPAQHGHTLDSQTIESLLASVGLAGFDDRDAKTLSGGEAQRVALVRALANRPEILLLDEPTSALDEVNRRTVEELIDRLIRERNLTCLWVTHSPEQARLADRVIRMEAGQIAAIGTPGQVLA
jgi:putative ABC transport system ATP-binding protein